ncbi:MAG: acyl carrier protein [Opitutaceae bacterium]
MAQAPRLNPDSNRVLSLPSGPSCIDDARLHAALKYCSPSTYEAACQFRQTGRPADLRAVVDGVIGRYVEPELRPHLAGRGDELRLIEDLGLDSLTLMEIVIRLEDVLPISIGDDDLRRFRTLGEIRTWIERHVASLASVVPLPQT